MPSAPVRPPHPHGDVPLTPPPPPRRSPHPFLWRCCACGTAYSLGATRRCLQCAHLFCLGAPAPAPSSPRGPGRRSRDRRGGRSRRRQRGPCAAEFDYDGWSAWTAWRAETRRRRRPATDRPRPGGGSAGPPKLPCRRRRFLNGDHDCWDDCAFPSECRHVRFREAMLLRQQQQQREVEEAEKAARAAAEEGGQEKEEEKGEGEEMDMRVWDPLPCPTPPLPGGSPAVDATQLSRAALAALLAEDDAMVPPDLLAPRASSPSSSSSSSSLSSSSSFADAEEEDLDPGSSSCSDEADRQEEENDDGGENEAVRTAWQ